MDLSSWIELLTTVGTVVVFGGLVALALALGDFICDTVAKHITNRWWK